MNTDAEKYLKKMLGKLTLGMAIRSIRQCEEESQVIFAKKIGVSTQFLCDLEHNRRIVSPKKAKEFAEKLGYSPQQFITLAIQDSFKQDGINMIVEVKAA